MSQARFISSHRKQRRALQYDNRPDKNPYCYPPCPSGLAKGRLTVVSPLMASYGVVSALLSVATGEKMTAATVIGLGLAIAGAIPVGDFGKSVISGKNIRLVASPNPHNPPFYFDLPTKAGLVQPDVLNRWAANAPISMVDQYVFNLHRYKAIAIDVGDRDGLKIDAEHIHHIMADDGLSNSFEIYSGDHVSGVADRFQNHVLPFFAANLSFDSTAPE